MKKEIEFCYLCDVDGKERIAVARYTADDDVEYAICKEHLKLVKENKFSFYLIAND